MVKIIEGVKGCCQLSWQHPLTIMKIQFTNDFKVLLIAFIFSLLLSIVTVFLFCNYLYTTSRYCTVLAKIVDITTEYDDIAHNSSNMNKYIYYKYSFNDREYTGKKLTLFTSKRQIGKETYIRVDPKSPEKIQNSLFVYINLFTTVICIAVTCIVIICIIEKSGSMSIKRTKNEKNR